MTTPTAQAQVTARPLGDRSRAYARRVQRQAHDVHDRQGPFQQCLRHYILDVADDLSRSSVEVEIDAASIATGDLQRDGHLMSPDFLDVANKSRQIEGKRERFRVIGGLTVRRKTREIALEAEFQGIGANPWGKTVAGFSASTEINREDFGLSWNVAQETGGVLVSDRLKITLEVQAVELA